MNRLNHRGDTIVEVLLAIAIIGSVLGIAYSTMHRNLLTMQSNQERTEATRLGQGQVEALRTHWVSNPSIIENQATAGFCISDTGVHPLDNGAPEANMDDDDLAGYEAECVNNHFRLAIRRDASDDLKYRVYVRWDRLGGGRNETMMVYRLPSL